jgi:hypothetical protein
MYKGRGLGRKGTKSEEDRVVGEQDRSEQEESTREYIYVRALSLPWVSDVAT